MDTLTREQRSRNMAAIRSKDTKPELYLRKLLFSLGFRYRLYSKKIPGKPDLWLAKYRTAIFIHGCFWHRHEGCKYATNPKSNIDYWTNKFQRNVIRDQNVREQLLKMNIKCLVIWECTIKKMKKDSSVRRDILNEISRFLNSDDKYECI